MANIGCGYVHVPCLHINLKTCLSCLFGLVDRCTLTLDYLTRPILVKCNPGPFLRYRISGCEQYNLKRSTLAANQMNLVVSGSPACTCSISGLQWVWAGEGCGGGTYIAPSAQELNHVCRRRFQIKSFSQYQLRLYNKKFPLTDHV